MFFRLVAGVGQRKNSDFLWGIEPQIFRFHMGTEHFFFVPRSWQDEKNIFLYFFTELKTYHVSYFYLLIDSTLPRLCSVIDHRRCQYVARTSETHLAVSRMFFLFFFFFPYHIFTSFVIYYWTDARQKHKCIFFLTQRAGYLNKV